MKSPLGSIMKQAQAVQENLKKEEEDLSRMEVIGSYVGGLVEVTMTCRHDIRKVSIDESLMGDDREVLEDLVAAAVNDAVRRVEKVSQEKMGSLTSGLNIPDLNLS